VSGSSLLAAAPCPLLGVAVWCGSLSAVGVAVWCCPLSTVVVWLCGAAPFCYCCGVTLFTTVVVQPLSIRCGVFNLVDADPPCICPDLFF
jgi:hypothetical protein